jgi:hypothetical protein
MPLLAHHGEPWVKTASMKLTLGGKPAISISLWAQYVLDNLATVPNGMKAQLHLSISDATGDSTTTPAVFWVPVAALDLKPGAPVKKLTVTGGRIDSGNVAGKFEPAKTFTFLPVMVK